MSKLTDSTGQTFGRLVVLSRAKSQRRGTRTRTAWNCRCACGAEIVALAESLRGGDTKSCGCLLRDIRHTGRPKHGACASTVRSQKMVEYSTWEAMKSRCLNPHAQQFRLYGGRGIAVCDRWRRDFTAFLADMGPRPSPKHSIDRIDNNGNYEPGNCRWATASEQARNMRVNRMITLGNETLCVAAWAARIGILYSTLLTRIDHGWTPLRALTEPVQARARSAR